MNEEPSSLPIACRPGALTKEQRERSRQLRESLATATETTIELAAGYSFQLRPDDELFRKAAEWMTLERRCCPFLTFDLRWPPGDTVPPVLSVTGPEGTKSFLAAEMPELPVEDRHNPKP